MNLTTFAPHQNSKSFSTLCLFNVLRRFFSSSRLSRAYCGTAVFLRIGLVLNASLNSSHNRSTAALLFAFCVRYLCEATLTTPSLFARVLSRFSIRLFCDSEKLPHFATSNRTVTRVLTLLTFCPPGPPLRENLKTSSSSQTPILSVISIISGRPSDYFSFIYG